MVQAGAAARAGDLPVVQQLRSFAIELMQKVDAFMVRHPQATQRAHLKQLEQRVNVPAPALFVAAASLLSLLLVLALSLEGLALLAGFLYPLLGTLKAVKVAEPAVMKFFLKYWLLYNFLNIAAVVLPFHWIPFFPVLKLLLLVWAFNPRTQGASIIYAILRPFLLPPLGIEPAAPAPAAASTTTTTQARRSTGGGGTAAAGTGAAAAVVGDKEGPGAAAMEESYTLRVELAARGLEKPPEPERLDTLCQLRVLPSATANRKAALDEGQWYKTPTHTTEPADEPDWTHDPQFITLPSLDDNVLEVVVISKMSWKDQPLGKVRLPLQGLSLPIDTAVPLEDPNGENAPVQGELEVHLSLAED